MTTLKSLVSSSSHGEQTRKLHEENTKRQLSQLQTEITDKDEKLESQEAQIKELIDRWERETEVRVRMKKASQEADTLEGSS